MFSFFKRTYNRSYAKVIRQLKVSTCFIEIQKLEEELFKFQTQRLERNFKNYKSNPRFDINEILLKNPIYLSYKKKWLSAHATSSITLWEARISYWEPLFKKVQKTFDSQGLVPTSKASF